MAKKKKSKLDKAIDKETKKAEKDLLKAINAKKTKTPKPRSKKVKGSKAGRDPTSKQIKKTSADLVKKHADERAARKAIEQLNRFLKLTSESGAEKTRDILKRKGFDFTKGGRVSMKNLKSKDLFNYLKDHAKDFQKDADRQKKANAEKRKRDRERQKEIYDFADETGMDRDEAYNNISDLIDDLAGRGNLWYHGPGIDGGDPSDNLAGFRAGSGWNLMLKINRENPDFWDQLGVDWYRDEKGHIHLEDHKEPDRSIDGYSIKDL